MVYLLTLIIAFGALVSSVEASHSPARQYIYYVPRQNVYRSVTKFSGQRTLRPSRFATKNKIEGPRFTTQRDRFRTEYRPYRNRLRTRWYSERYGVRTR